MAWRLGQLRILGLGANMYLKNRHISVKQVSILFSSFGMVHYSYKCKEIREMDKGRIKTGLNSIKRIFTVLLKT